MNNTAIAYQHFSLEQWKIIATALEQQARMPYTSVHQYNAIVEILKLLPSAAL